jgi:hypothetical protein
MNRIALHAGLKVTEFGIRTPTGGWYTGASGEKTQERKDKTYNKLIQKYSVWFKRANHFAIMRKPSETKTG